MKRTIFSALSAVSLGALAGFIISDLPKGADLPTARERAAWKSSLVTAKSAAPAKSFAAAMERLSGTKPVTVESKPARNSQSSSVGLMLKEQVIVVQSSGEGSARLPRGTVVDLVRNEGRFLRVRHEQSVMTIPRSAVVSNLARTNWVGWRLLA